MSGRYRLRATPDGGLEAVAERMDAAVDRMRALRDTLPPTRADEITRHAHAIRAELAPEQRHAVPIPTAIVRAGRLEDRSDQRAQK